MRAILKSKSSKDYIDRCVPGEGIPEFGVTRNCTALMIAMSIGGSLVVEELLQFGANIHKVDVNGSDAFLFACATGNTANVR